MTSTPPEMKMPQGTAIPRGVQPQPVGKDCPTSLADSKLAVIFEMKVNEQTKRHEVIGQTAKALLALHRSGTRGCTAQEVAGWAYRMASYVYDLRHKYNLDIRTDKELHHGGWHARYTLVSAVSIIGEYSL